MTLIKGCQSHVKKINVRHCRPALAPTLLGWCSSLVCGQLAGCPHPDKLAAEEHDWHLSAQLGHLWPTFHHYPILGLLHAADQWVWKYNVPVIHSGSISLYVGIFSSSSWQSIGTWLAHTGFALKARTVTLGAVTSTTWVVAVFAFSQEHLPNPKKKAHTMVAAHISIQSVSFLEEFPKL